MRTVWLGTILSAVASIALVTSCGADSEVDCTSGEQRSCGACPLLYPYVGCGQLGALVAIAIEGLQECTGNGTWGECSCLVDVESECTSEPTDECAQTCSHRTQMLASDVPAGGDEPLCQTAYVTLLECAGESCGWIGEPGPECAAELEALDLACLGVQGPAACP